MKCITTLPMSSLHDKTILASIKYDTLKTGIVHIFGLTNVVHSFLATRPGLSGSEEVEILFSSRSGCTSTSVCIQTTPSRLSSKPDARLLPTADWRTFTKHSSSSCHSSTEKTQPISAQDPESLWQQKLMEICLNWNTVQLFMGHLDSCWRITVW